MIEILVDGTPVYPGQIEMHQQLDPFPGGARYKLRTNDRDLVEVVSQRYPATTANHLKQADVSHIFNLLRMFVSLKLDRSPPLFWANTIDELVVNGDGLELSGVCSPHRN